MRDNIGLRIIVLMAIILHMVWAVGLYFDPAAVNATGLNTMLVLTHSVPITSWLFAGVATLAGVALFTGHSLISALLLIPQQVILWFSVVGALNAMSLGQFADGVQRSHWFLIVDQVGVPLIALAHTMTLLLLAGRVDDARRGT